MLTLRRVFAYCVLHLLLRARHMLWPFLCNNTNPPGLCELYLSGATRKGPFLVIRNVWHTINIYYLHPTLGKRYCRNIYKATHALFAAGIFKFATFPRLKPDLRA